MPDPPPLGEIRDFLTRLHDAPVRGLAQLAGGYWSRAFGYEVDGRALVLRLGADADGFEADRAAMAFGGPDLPVPAVLDVGAAFGGAYAVSERHFGRFLESVAPEEAGRAGPALARLLGALRAVPAGPGAPVEWSTSAPAPGPGPATWRDWLRAGLVDDPARRVSGWRARLAAEPALDRLFRACERRLDDLAGGLPERRDLVHGDLLHANVLVSGDAARVTAVFSWKCSVRGDFLYDVAWCTFWGAWYPGIAAAGVWEHATAGLDAADLDGAPERHHCYELHIGATGLAWRAWTNDDRELHVLAGHVAAVLERGPLRRAAGRSEAAGR